MKPTFLNHSEPLMTCMIQCSDPSAIISTVRNALYDGAEAFGFQLCKIPVELRNKETLQSIYRHMEDKPIYITNYRGAFSKDHTEEERAEFLLQGLEWGANLCDVMGDYYDPTPGELTWSPVAIDKQKKLVDTIHQKGGEVLMSCHTHKFMTAEQVLEMAHAHQDRGADISKIVAAANSEEEEMENLRICTLLRKELKIPFLFLCSGSHTKLLRMMGPFLGSVMWLCVQQHDALSTKQQPVLRAVRNVKNSFDYKPERTFDL
ncbi:MAG: type I 3-dehydroquinate dehydratase [Clostridiales bacterium]|nr:type I 3-dehydroquinate dehydratase [Clostridiales bacterium]